MTFLIQTARMPCFSKIWYASEPINTTLNKQKRESYYKPHNNDRWNLEQI